MKQKRDYIKLHFFFFHIFYPRKYQDMTPIICLTIFVLMNIEHTTKKSFYHRYFTKSSFLKNIQFLSK